MYAEAKKAIYGTLEASLLFWGELSKSLEEMGYQRKEYDRCVINKIVDKKNAPYSGTLMTQGHHISTLSLFPAFLLTLMRNMGRFKNDHHTGQSA